MTAEESHEKGRRGVFQAKALLERLFDVSLPFTAYDNAEKLRFEGREDLGLSEFSFDLWGFFHPSAADGKLAAEVFVEVKTYQSGSTLRTMHRDFLRRVACVSLAEKHRHTWFIFSATAPFGVRRSADLCNGNALAQAISKWPGAVRQKLPTSLHERTATIISTPSFVRLVDRWGKDVPRGGHT